MKNLIFIGGIHGVGKGFICNEITKNSDLIHVTASEVLKWNEISDINNKLVENVKDTQERLILNLSLILKSENKYLLDGHYCLLNNLGKPERIPLDTFIKIAPQKLIVVYEDPKVIKQRLEERDAKYYDEQSLMEFQDTEINYAEKISENLNIELLKIKSTLINTEEIKKFIR